MSEPKFNCFVLKLEGREVKPFNIFRNINLYDATLREVKRYVRSPKTYKSSACHGDEKEGFEGFCQELESLIQWQEWGRVEYEISVSEPFPDENSHHQKIDCYYQAAPNIEMIAREVIYQYKAWKKEQKSGNCSDESPEN